MLNIKMEIKTDAFENFGKIPERYTTDGINVNPKLLISNIPKGAKSLVLIVDDPDAQRVCGFTWVHWVVFDILVSSDKLTIEENSIPGVAGESTYKKKDYGGPNPPKGTGIHNYFFKFFALDKTLDLEEMTSLEKIEQEMQGHILDKAEIVGTYSGE